MQDQRELRRFKKILGGMLGAVGCLLFSVAYAYPQTFSAGKAAFGVLCNGQKILYHTQAVFVLPHEQVHLKILSAPARLSYYLYLPGGRRIPMNKNRYVWQAPRQSGMYPLRFQCPQIKKEVRLNCFVLVPRSRFLAGKINGYLIGTYPRPGQFDPLYPRPRGFIEVTPANQDVLLSPHFKLRQFVCKQSTDFPKYLVLADSLITKLERLLEELNQQGYTGSTLEILSGYRTPYYNRLLGNVRFSFHLWGGAADVFLDANRDGCMDDLNQDGQYDWQDAWIIAELVNRLDEKCELEILPGGLGIYNHSNLHGPFVHIDVRGKMARWGKTKIKRTWAGKKSSPGHDAL